MIRSSTKFILPTMIAIASVTLLSLSQMAGSSHQGTSDARGTTTTTTLPIEVHGPVATAAVHAVEMQKVRHLVSDEYVMLVLPIVSSDKEVWISLSSPKDWMSRAATNSVAIQDLVPQEDAGHTSKIAARFTMTVLDSRIVLEQGATTPGVQIDGISTRVEISDDGNTISHTYYLSEDDLEARGLPNRIVCTVSIDRTNASARLGTNVYSDQLEHVIATAKLYQVVDQDAWAQSLESVGDEVVSLMTCNECSAHVNNGVLRFSGRGADVDVSKATEVPTQLADSPQFAIMGRRGMEERVVADSSQHHVVYALDPSDSGLWWKADIHVAAEDGLELIRGYQTAHKFLNALGRPSPSSGDPSSIIIRATPARP